MRREFRGIIVLVGHCQHQNRMGGTLPSWPGLVAQLPGWSPSDSFGSQCSRTAASGSSLASVVAFAGGWIGRQTSG